MSRFRIGQAVRVVDGDYRSADGVIKAAKEPLFLVGFGGGVTATVEWIHESLLSECLVPESDPHGKSPSDPGAKLDNGKILAGVLLDFSRALEAVAEVGTFGANKYSRGGWRSVPNGEQRYADALVRHLLAIQRESADPDSGLDHVAHLAWNCLAVLELRLQKRNEPAPGGSRQSQ